jgi:hypothetical protein
MNPSTELHQLLHSLSQAEKRYLRVYTTRHVKGKENQYAIMLDAIWEQEEYDEGLLKRQWKAAGANPNQLASVKNYLFGLVLQAMRDFHRERNVRREIEDLLTDAEFLGSRGLYPKSEKLLAKAKEKAVAYELHALALQADAIARSQAIWTFDREVDQQLHDLAASSKDSLSALVLGTEAQIVYCQTVALTRRKFSLRDSDSRNQIESIKAHPAIVESSGSAAFTPQLHHLRTMALVAQLQGKKEDTLAANHALYLLWEAHAPMQSLYTKIHIVSLANFLASCHISECFTEMPAIISKLQSIPTQSPADEIEITHNALYYTLLHAINTAAWDTAAATAKALETFLTNSQKAIPKARVTAIRYNIAITYFFLEEHKLALHAFNAILHDAQSLYREDIQQAARLLQTVVHYQLGNLDLLEYLLRSVRRYLQNRDALYAFEETLIRHLNRLAANPTEQKAIMQTLHEHLQTLRTDNDNAHAPGLQEVQYWVEAKLKGCPLREMVT